MELKAYAAVLWRRWYLVALVPLLVLVGVLYQISQEQRTYTATARLSIIRPGEEPATGEFQYDSYYRYLASEFALDDMVEVTRGNVFASDVAEKIQETTGTAISAGEVQGSLRSERKHRILTLEANSSDSDHALLIAGAAAQTLEEKGTTYFGFSEDTPAMVETIERPEFASSNTTRQLLLYALQLFAALFAGVVLAYLVDYLDDTLRSAETVSTALDLPVIGMIPRGRGLR